MKTNVFQIASLVIFSIMFTGLFFQIGEYRPAYTVDMHLWKNSAVFVFIIWMFGYFSGKGGK